jgi:hypothetical protein
MGGRRRSLLCAVAAAAALASAAVMMHRDARTHAELLHVGALTAEIDVSARLPRRVSLAVAACVCCG